MTDTDYESVRVLRLQPGDVLVLRMPYVPSDAQIEGIKDRMRRIHPDHEVLVLGKGVDLQIHREVDTDTRCSHHTPTGQCLDHQGHLGNHQPPSEDR